MKSLNCEKLKKEHRRLQEKHRMLKNQHALLLILFYLASTISTLVVFILALILGD